jgi:hypothetical protein
VKCESGNNAVPLSQQCTYSIFLVSILLSLGTMMLTGQGGPDGDLPWYTKAVVLLTSVFSVAMFAIPASMLTWGFEAEAARCAKRAFQKSKAGPTQYSSSDEDDDRDEEYFKIIAGDENDVDEDSPWERDQKRTFRLADTDHSGSRSLQEFLRLQQQNQALPPQLGGGGSPMAAVAAAGCDEVINLALEAYVNANSDKLDRILHILEQQKHF